MSFKSCLNVQSISLAAALTAGAMMSTPVMADLVEVTLPTPTLKSTRVQNSGILIPTQNLATVNAAYSDITTFTGFGVNNGGSTTTGTRTTKVLLDDTNLNTTAAVPVAQMSFTVANLNTVAVSSRVRLRIYASDGPSGGPGTLLGAFSFAAFSQPVGVSTYFTTFAAGQFTIPASATGTIWTGEFFDNSGATATTAAQMNNLGTGTFDPVDVGSSLDRDFLSTAADTGGFLTANPVGSIRTAPLVGASANYGYEYVSAVPEPASLSLLAFSGLLLRRRKA